MRCAILTSHFVGEVDARIAPSGEGYRNRKNQHAGLTLIEVLIALAIISIAVTAVIKATTQTISSTAYLQEKTMANWVAQKILNEASVDVFKISSDQEKQIHHVNMLNREWYFRVAKAETPNMHIKKIMVKVYATHQENADLDMNDDDAPTLANLETYVYHAQ